MLFIPRGDKQVYVFSGLYFDDDFMPTNLGEAIAWLEKKLAEIPEEFRPHASIEVDTESDYDAYNARLEISYVRPETDGEWGERAHRERLCFEQGRAIERAQYEALKAKYG